LVRFFPLSVSKCLIQMEQKFCWSYLRHCRLFLAPGTRKASRKPARKDPLRNSLRAESSLARAVAEMAEEAHFQAFALAPPFAFSQPDPAPAAKPAHAI